MPNTIFGIKQGMPEKHYTVTISSLTIVKIVIVLLALVFLYIVRDIVLVLFLALIFASAIDPWVDWFERRKMPRWLGMLVMYIAFFSIIILIFVQLIPALREQVNQVTTYFPKYYESVQTVIGNFQLSTPQNTQSSDTLHQSLQGVSDQINKWTNPSNLFSAASGVIGSVAMFVLVLVLTFYLVVEDRGMKRALRAVTPDKIQPYLTQLLSRIQTKMGLWLRGQIILSFIIFAFTWLGLTILGVPYSLLLALIAGIFEIVPFLGPIFSALVAMFFVLAQGDIVKVILVGGLYYIIQFFENHVIVPKIMQKAVGLNPIVSIVAVLVGGKIAGIAGAIIAIPLVTAASVFLRDVFEKEDKEEDA